MWQRGSNEDIAAACYRMADPIVAAGMFFDPYFLKISAADGDRLSYLIRRVENWCFAKLSAAASDKEIRPLRSSTPWCSAKLFAAASDSDVSPLRKRSP